MPLIEDRELNQLFREESAERLQRIDAGLLRLEQAPDDPELIEEIFRDVHSLKGALHMLGLAEMHELAHAMEEHLAAARHGEKGLTPDLIQSQLQALDRIDCVAIFCET